MLVLQYAPMKKEQQYDISIDDILIEKDVQHKSQEIKTKDRKASYPNRKSQSKQQSTKKKTFERFSFDPNRVSKDSLIRLGFKKRVADTWIKFRSKGMKFKNEEDIKSIYGIDSSLVSRLKNFMIFPKRKKAFKETEKKEKVDNQKIYSTTVTKIPTKKIDLNSCSEEDLKALGGIGRIFASRILKYRELLGGFVRKEQLLEVYGLTDSTFQIVKEFVEISSPPNKLKVNSASKEQLSAHFLVDYKSAKLIYAYRKEHGPFVDSKDFKSIKGIPEDKKNEIIPYLSFAL